MCGRQPRLAFGDALSGILMGRFRRLEGRDRQRPLSADPMDERGAILLSLICRQLHCSPFVRLQRGTNYGNVRSPP